MKHSLAGVRRDKDGPEGGIEESLGTVEPVRKDLGLLESIVSVAVYKSRRLVPERG